MRRALSPLPVLAVLASLPLLLAAPRAHADAGMWTFDNFPGELVKRKYGADINRPWLDRVRSSVVRLSNCTASFVSPDGLILTNHHCSEACLDEHSSAGDDLVGNIPTESVLAALTKLGASHRFTSAALAKPVALTNDIRSRYAHP